MSESFGRGFHSISLGVRIRTFEVDRMALKLEDKKAVVCKVKAIANAASSLVLADFTGISADQMTALRREAHASNVRVFVLQNRLTKLAFKDTPYDYFSMELSGPCLCGFSMDHPRSAVRVFKNFLKSGAAPTIKSAGFEGEVLVDQKIEWLALLPTREEALGQWLMLLKELVGAKFARVLAARGEQLAAEEFVQF